MNRQKKAPKSVYGAAIGLGYAAIENVGYLSSSSLENAWTIQMVKTRYYPLVMHMGFGVLMGWLLSLNLFEERNIFKRNSSYFLKVTYWFEMKSDYKGRLKPQLKEGISKVQWIDNNEISKISSDCYANIRVLLN